MRRRRSKFSSVLRRERPGWEVHLGQESLRCCSSGRPGRRSRRSTTLPLVQPPRRFGPASMIACSLSSSASWHRMIVESEQAKQVYSYAVVDVTRRCEKCAPFGFVANPSVIRPASHEHTTCTARSAVTCRIPYLYYSMNITNAFAVISRPYQICLNTCVCVCE